MAGQNKLFQPPTNGMILLPIQFFTIWAKCLSANGVYRYPQSPSQLKQPQLITQKSILTSVALDSGWYKFNYTGPGAYANASFTFDTPYWVRISVTDAWCVGDSFDLLKDGGYLVTTPRVDKMECFDAFTEDPDDAFWSDKWSSSRFMLPGPFNITIRARDSPFEGGGAGWIRADTRILRCETSVKPFTLLNEPFVMFNQIESTCKRGGLAGGHIKPENVMEAVKTLVNCGTTLAWYGKLSLALNRKTFAEVEEDPIGCAAFDISDPLIPAVAIVDCNQLLPVLCE